ncbi:hypothetical protein CBR_g2912 [Chara braunii]|uniref:Integrase catalytic domain-containing protein n=1 Tax=Chara braunii TaxID=69332 RepID=A0A388KE92_CHABU|nr:hypothetical protein CBR_g2912 [Chara braunii]|eukprot:GBG68369.1 hypothetical protein CBR_g2912 [Chara braunii]
MVDKRAATLPSKYDGKADITSWISSMRSYFEVMRTPQEDRSMIMGTNTEPAVGNYIELQAVAAGYARVDLTDWLKVTPVRTLEDLLLDPYQYKHAALKARLKLEALKGQTWRSSMQALEQHLTGLFTTPDLGMTDVSCMDVVMGVAPKEYLSLLALKDHATWRELMKDLFDLEAKDLARRKKAPAAGGKPQRKRFGGSNQLALHDHREADDQSYADDLPLDDDLEPDSDTGCVGITFDKDRTVTHELNFYVLDKCPFDAVIGLGWLKAHCPRTTWADNQFVVLDAKGNERTVLLDETRESPVTLLSATKFCSKSMEEHVKHLEEVLQVLKDAQLHLNLEKSEFGRDNVIYLGHRLSASGLEPEATKVEVICNWPQPANVREVHRHKPYGLLRPLPIPDGPGESISIDFTDMGKVSEAGNSQVMVIVDRFSKFLNLIPLPPHAPTELVIEEFHQQYILQSVVPKTIVSDRDTRFISKDWKDFTSEIYDIKLNRTSGRHPEANGLAEEINQIVIQLLRALIVPDQNTWDKELHKVKGLYNNSIHSATGVTPNQLQYGWPMRNPLSYLFPERSPGLMPGMPGYNAKYVRLLKAATAAMNKRQHAMIKHANKRRKEEMFKVGDYVWVKMSEFSDEEGISRKLLPRYYGPWQILKWPKLTPPPMFSGEDPKVAVADWVIAQRTYLSGFKCDEGVKLAQLVANVEPGNNVQYSDASGTLLKAFASAIKTYQGKDFTLASPSVMKDVMDKAVDQAKADKVIANKSLELSPNLVLAMANMSAGLNRNLEELTLPASGEQNPDVMEVVTMVAKISAISRGEDLMNDIASVASGQTSVEDFVTKNKVENLMEKALNAQLPSTFRVPRPHAPPPPSKKSGKLDKKERDIVIGVVVGIGGPIVLGVIAFSIWLIIKRFPNRRVAAGSGSGTGGVQPAAITIRPASPP